MKELRLGDLFRYALPGGLFLLTALLTYRETLGSFLKLATLPEATAYLALALIIGSVLQSAHRCLVYPYIHPEILRWTVGKPPFGFRHFAPTKLQLQLFRQRRRLYGKTWLASWSGDWGARIQFVYASAWALILGGIGPGLLQSLTLLQGNLFPLTLRKIVVVLVLFVVALYSAAGDDFRSWTFEIAALEDESTGYISE